MSELPDQHLQLTQWLTRGTAGDAACYRQFLLEITPILRRVVARKISESYCEDVVQEILISVHKARHTFNGDRPVMPWLLAIAHFRINDALRKHYAVDHKNVELEEAWLEDVTQTPFDTESFDELLKGTTQREAQILTLMHVDGYTAKEIASKLELSESAIKVAAHRAIKKLRLKTTHPQTKK